MKHYRRHTWIVPNLLQETKQHKIVWWRAMQHAEHPVPIRTKFANFALLAFDLREVQPLVGGVCVNIRDEIPHVNAIKFSAGCHCAFCHAGLFQGAH